MDIEIRDERAGDVPAREWLLDCAMGPIRFRRASQRLREGRLPAHRLALVAEVDGALVGTLRLWNVKAHGLTNALMLGPLAVSDSHRGAGIGRALARTAIVRARQAGHSAIILVGDAEYYGQFGFQAEPASALAMPGPFERHRLLALALQADGLAGARGLLRANGMKAPRESVAMPLQMAAAVPN